jgi:Matrixin
MSPARPSRRRRWLLALAVLTGACGGGGASPAAPTVTPAPTPTTPPLPTILDGITGALVPGAVVNPQAPGRNDRVMVSAAGYLVREQLFVLEPIRLWPASPDFVRQIVYSSAATGQEIAMRRFGGTGFVVSLPPEVDGDPRARNTFEEAVKETSRASGLDVRLGADGVVRLVIEPESFVGSPQTCAFTRLWLQEEIVVIRAEVVYPNALTARGLPGRCEPFGLAAHELGHVLGLQHVDDGSSLMNPSIVVRAYSPREEDTLTMMYRYRQPGNALPDREVGLAKGTRTVRVETIRN